MITYRSSVMLVCNKTVSGSTSEDVGVWVKLAFLRGTTYNIYKSKEDQTDT